MERYSALLHGCQGPADGVTGARVQCLENGVRVGAGALSGSVREKGVGPRAYRCLKTPSIGISAALDAYIYIYISIYLSISTSFQECSPPQFSP